MSLTHFYICAIPQVVWSQPANEHGFRAEITHFVTDALGCERRIAKEINLENEYNRYTLCCQRLEQEIILSNRLKFINQIEEFGTALQAGQFPAQILDPEYLAILAQTLDQPGWERLGATFFPPEQLSQHATAFQLWATQQNFLDVPVIEQRLTFLQAAEQANCGVIEIQTNYHLPKSDTTNPIIILGKNSAENEDETGGFIHIPEFVNSGVEVEFFGPKGKKTHLARVLRQQILAALKNDEPVTFGNQAPHDVITEVLNELVFMPEGEAILPMQMRVAYADGSEAPPFPLFCLPRSLKPADLGSPLRIALMSMRHLELDPEIDFCWFRNRDVSRTRTLAETDLFCFNSTLSQLTDSLKLGPLLIHIYHTGFEPAVLGFYRGVAQTLIELKNRQLGSLAVVPFYYRGENGYQHGTEWQ